MEEFANKMKAIAKERGGKKASYFLKYLFALKTFRFVLSM